MKSEVKGYKNKDVVLTVIVDQNKFLPEFIEASEETKDSCMGGILLHTRRGRIVCTNTLDERLSLVYAEAIPEIRERLFPCFIKPAKEVKEMPIGNSKH